MREPMNPDKFWEVVRAVRARDKNPDDFEALKEDDNFKKSWERLQEVYDASAKSLKNGLAWMKDEEWTKKAASRQVRSWGRGGLTPSANSIWNVELALVLGEIERLSSMKVERAREEDFAPEVEFPQDMKEKLEGLEEWHVKGLFPLVSAMNDVLIRHRYEDLNPDTDHGFDLAHIEEVLKSLEKLQKILNVKPKTVMRANVGHRIVADAGSRLAGKSVLPKIDFAKAFQIAYDNSWHTKPKTKSPTGGFTSLLRERTIKEGDPELMVVLSASSDGRQREVSGISPRTPIEVYDKMIYDNALHVLQSVVQNPRFENNRAYSMINTELAPQISAVMTHGRVDMSIRVLACERAIEHPEVDPMHIYGFLAGNVRNPAVPKALWRSYILEIQKRLVAMRAKSEEEQEKAYMGRLERLSKSLMTDMLLPYRQAHKALSKYDERQSRYYRGRINEYRQFVESHEFIKDPRLLDILVEAAKTEKDLLDLLKLCVETDLPVTKKLTVAVFKHESRDVRVEAMKLLPHVDEEQVDKLALELEKRVQEDFEAVREHVHKSVIPDFEQITGTPRELSRNKHFFEAADDLTAEELVTIYCECYEKDPRTIPEEFRKKTEMRRHAQKLDSKIESATQEWQDSDLDRKPVTQGDLFDGISVSDGTSSIIKKSKKAEPKTRR